MNLSAAFSFPALTAPRHIVNLHTRQPKATEASGETIKGFEAGAEQHGDHRADRPFHAAYRTQGAPIKLFAVAIVLAVFARTLIQWVRSPYFAPSPMGGDPVFGWLHNLIRFTDIFFGSLVLWFLWSLLFKPWMRDKRISWDGMLMMALFAMWVQDPMCNYFNFTFMYNSDFINMGSWSSFLPGWQSPRGSNLPEPIFLMGGIYLWWTTINVIAVPWSLKKLRGWLPTWSNVTPVSSSAWT